ncbi:MAG: hypothetical protein OXM03_07135 [Chloroflexota bacterium]|nr:hypothetical protein [Chloroflexota bacterium]MDE2840387.1 hypothetical protein [Chloroflexota bacterium]MDE2932071.1 hypothetical protein [Chloroflexota bacterium]
MRVRTTGHIVVASVILVLGMIFVAACSVQPVEMPVAEPAVELDDDALSRAYVEEAVAYFDKHGLEKTIEFYSTGESVDGERYLMLMDPKTYIATPRRFRFWSALSSPCFNPVDSMRGRPNALRRQAIGPRDWASIPYRERLNRNACS